MPQTIASIGNWIRTTSPANSCVVVNTSADAGVIAPRAIGRNFVRVTLGSMSRSQRSLMAHPAPRMIRAPTPNSKVVERTVGNAIAGSTRVLARRVDHMHGKKR